MGHKAKNKQNRNNPIKNNSSDINAGKHSGRSQQRLALALLLIFLIAFAFFIMSDDPRVTGLREKLTGQSEQGTEAPDAESYDPTVVEEYTGEESSPYLSSKNLPEFNGKNYTEVNDNRPVYEDKVYEAAGLVKDGKGWKTEGGVFSSIDSSKVVSYEHYGKLDKRGRCTVAYGCLSRDTMPASGENRGDISKIHPSGWAKAQNWERCHLIAWALGAENANERNLVTGTHYLNYDGMRPLEEEVEHYIWNTGNHVLYLAMPCFASKELVPRGVQMIAWSVEDQGKGISFNVYCFNVTPGASIDYTTGIVTTAEQASQEAREYVINTRSGVFHYPTCEGAVSISARNRKVVTATRVELTSQGYTPCGYCEP